MASRDLTREITVASGQYVKEENYWLDKLSGELVKSYFPYDFNLDKDKQTRAEAAFDTFKFGIEGELFSKLMALSSGAEKVLHLVLTAGVALLLNKYSYDAGDDIIVGVPIYKQDIEGDFINTILALRIRLEEGITFKELLIQVKQVFIQANENQNYPIETLLYLLNIPYSQGEDFPLFDVAILVQGLHAGTYLNQVRLNTIFSFNRSDEGLAGELEYNALLYKKTTIERIIRLLKQLLLAVVSDIDRPLSAVPLTSGKERQQLFFEFNRTDAHYPQDKTLQQLFEQQVERTPGHTAVIGLKRRAKSIEPIQITYHELNKRVNRLARLLRQKGVKADTIVGIMVERSLEMIVGIFAILKAGGAYLPIDPETPVQRMAMMLEDARAPMLLTATRDIKGKSWTVLKGIPRVRSRPHLTGRRTQITDLDGLPIPDRSLVSYDKYRNYIGFGRVKNCISIQGTRGCPYKCAYCHKIWPKKHVFRSAENLVEEVKLYYDMGIHRFAIIDDIFNVNVKNSSRFYELIIKNGLDVHFFFPTGIRGDILSEDYIELMIEAGAIDFAVALETASPRLQKLIGKNLDIEKLHGNIEYICKKYPQVILELFTMHGFPSETEEEAMATLEFIKSQKWLHFPYINILRIYLNTDMEKLAIAHGISRQSIIEADTLSQHDFADTLPFDRSFTKKYQSEFLNEYFLNRERLLHVLPHQMKIFTRDELAQRYESYLPVDIHRFEDFLEFAGIKEEELDSKQEDILDEKSIEVPNLDEKIKSHFPVKAPVPDALRLLMLDLSQFFRAESSHMLYDVHEPPLGLMTLMTCLKREFGEKVNGKVAKSRIDFDTYEELREILEVFKPNFIGIRTLTFYKEFFHEAVAMIRHWGIDVPIIAGGPYATSDYATILQDRNVDLVVLGEGELTFTELVNEILKNGGKLPGDDVLKEIKGMAFIPSVPGISRWEASFSREVLLLDTFPGRFDEDDDNEGPAENPGHINHPGDLAYVIYTSGSTGLPKGVMIRHRSLVNRLNWMQKAYPIAESDVILHKTPFIFDVSVWEIFWWAIRGSSVCLLGAGEERNPEAIIEAVETNRVTTMHFVPSMLNAFCGYVDVDGSENVKRLSSLRQVFSSGEALGPHLVETFYRLVNADGGSRTRLINLYGPTEATVDVSYFDCPPHGKPDVVPIGKPIDNIRLYVVNRDFQVQPPGLAGELCISGDGLARGYLNRPELTGEKFFNYRSYRSYSLHFSKKIYRTGDLARWLPGGNIEFLGRIDHQVKIRGLRIELGEIESLLLKHRDIDEAVLSAKEDNYGDRILCAYIVSCKEIVTSELKDYLARELPDYYIPSYFMQIEEIPLTSSGKVDRKGLPEIEIARDEYITPRDRLEEKLAAIWQEVLGLERVSVRDNLFNIGGDSIKTIKLVSTINTRLNANLKIVDIYANETVEKLAYRIKQEKPSGGDEELEVEVLKEIESLKNRVLAQDKLQLPNAENIEDIYPMSDIERGVLFLYLKGRENFTFHTQMVYQVPYHRFEPVVFKKAMALMVEKHPILRTCFDIGDINESLQLVYKDVSLDIEHYDISEMESHEQESYVKKFMEEDRRNPFNLTEPLWRLRTFETSPGNIVLLWIVHHSIIDGWSNAIFLKELNNTYQELKSNPNFVPQKLKNTYKAYVVEQLVEKRKGEVFDYWKKELEGYTRLDFPVSPGNNDNGVERRAYNHDLGVSMLESLKDAARKYSSTVKDLCFAGFVYMLNMFSYENDIVVGILTNSRPVCEDGDKIVGYFLNPIPVRIKIPAKCTWLDYIDLMNRKMLELKKYERLPFAEIVRIIGEKSGDRNPFFDMLFNFVDFYVYREIKLENLQDETNKNINLYGYLNTTSLIDFNVNTTMGMFFLSLSYSNLIDDQLVRNLCVYVENILIKFIHEPEAIAAKGAVISDGERRELLDEFNSTKAGYQGEKTIHELFEEQVSKSPDRTAIVYKNKVLTYRELAGQCRRTAVKLKENGVREGDIVGLMLSRTEEMVIGIMGILEANAVCLPIDLEYPGNRVMGILKDSGARLLLKQSLHQLSFEFPGVDIDLDCIGSALVGDTWKGGQQKQDQFAYVIYTSGSTGKPKGTLLYHPGIINHTFTKIMELEARAGDVFCHNLNIVFVASIWQFFAPLFIGSRLHIYPEDILASPYEFFTRVEDDCITIVEVVPSLLKVYLQLLAERKKKINLDSLKMMVLTGEKVTPLLVNQFYKQYNIPLMNAYGQSECSDDTLHYKIPYNAATRIVPVGRPSNNTRVYILGETGELQPTGGKGELHIGGDGLSAGYLNRPELTVENFVDNPFKMEQKFYKTGDFARWLPSRHIEFLGRRDHQAKIRGNLVELGEIESQLLKHGGIQDVVLQVREDEKGDNYLCAYIVSSAAIDNVNDNEPGVKPLVSELREYLSGELPVYMIPTYFVRLKKIPLTPSGKVDRKALPDPDAADTGRLTTYVAPGDEVEKKLVEIWSEILLLEKDSIGIDDVFSQLGGNSLNSTIIAARVHKSFNVKLEVSKIFQTPTIRGLARYIKDLPRDGYTSIEPVEEKEYYMLSPAQKRLYILHQMDPGSTVYNMPAIQMVTGSINKDKLKNVFRRLIHRHASLRTSFTIIDEEPVQRVHKQVEFEIEHYSTGHAVKSTEGSGESRYLSLEVEKIIKDFVTPFDLSQVPLLRAGLIELSKEEKHLLVVDMHHIISDGTSLGIIVRDFMALYFGEELPVLPLQYRDYAEWQNKEKQEEIVKKQERFWLNEFKGEIPVLDLPLDYIRPRLQSFEGSRISFEIEAEATGRLNRLAESQGATLFMVLLAAFNILLAKLSNQEDIIVGSPTVGRRHADLDNIMGMFVNTLALRNYPGKEKVFEEFLEELKKRVWGALENQDYPFEDLIDKLSLVRDTGRNPLFDIMFTLQNQNPNRNKQATVAPDRDLYHQYRSYDRFLHQAKFDLTLAVVEVSDKLLLHIEYCTKLFTKHTIRRFIDYFREIISSVAADSKQRLVEIDILKEEEKTRLLYGFNNTDARYPTAGTIYELFAEQVKRTPGNNAVLGPGTMAPLSYMELSEKTGSLAQHLRLKGVKPGTIVAVMVECSREMIIGILAIMKSGGAYLPIDPLYPAERVTYMIEDSAAGLLLTRKPLVDDIIDDICEVIDLEDENIYLPGGEKEEKREPGTSGKNGLKDLAYAMYTSGSTGKPKGVVVEHKSVINILSALQRYYPFGESDVYLLKTSYIFDVSITELFGWFLGGGGIAVLERNAEKDPQRIVEALGYFNITHINFVPSLFKSFLDILTDVSADADRDTDTNSLSGLKYIFLAGEALPPELVLRFGELNTGVRLENIYGPTEAAIYASRYSLSDWNCNTRIPIGKPVQNVRLYILGQYNELLPVGLVGELFIAGDGLARGYLNRPQLTAETFIYHPFQPGCRLYKTGDWVRWLSDGNIEYIGRIDQQIKIRGIRVELGEIENHIMNHEYIKKAVVIAKEDETGGKYLCAYVVPAFSTATHPDFSLNFPELRAALSRKIPGYMVPAFFVQVSEIPLTPSGKIDRKALPDHNLTGGEKYVPPRNRGEKKLVKIWAEVLNIDEELIGIDSNFFARGGHSLKLIKLISKIHKEFNVKLPFAEMFKNSTIRYLDRLIEQKTGEDQYVSIEPAEKKEYYVLSSAQKRLYFLQQTDMENTGYNMPLVQVFEDDIDKDKLEDVFGKLIDRYESLRTSFHVVDREPFQKIHHRVVFGIEYHEFNGGSEKAGQPPGVVEEEIEAVINNFIKPFDLGKAPLFRVGLIKSDGNRTILMVDMHHIISDGTSMELLTKEFISLYAGQELEPLRIQYKDYSEWQNREKNGEIIKRQEEYWLRELAGEIHVLNLPADYPRPLIQGFEGNTLSAAVGEDDTEALRSLALKEEVTLFMLLLAIYNVLLAKVSGRGDIIVGTPTEGRPHDDLRQIIGMFANTLALRNYPGGEKPFKLFLEEVRERSLEAFENQEYPFEELVEKAAINRDVSRNPLFDVVFTLQNRNPQRMEVEKPGLKVKPYEYESRISKFDITLRVYEAKQTLIFTVEYCTKIFKIETIRRLINHLLSIIKHVCAYPGIRIADIDILTGEDKYRLLCDFNDTSASYPEDKTIHELFEQQAERSPGGAALVGNREETHITYGVLNEKADRLAGYLRSRGVGPDIIVGLMVDRSIEMIVGILGILKAGGAYLPMEIGSPEERIRYMLAESNTGILLTVPGVEVKDREVEIIDIANLLSSPTPTLTLTLTWRVSPANLAYVIYTSGTTGKPKGALIRHGNVVRLMFNDRFLFDFDNRDVWTMFHSCSFDFSVWEMYGALLYGGKLVITAKIDAKDPRRYLEILKQQRVTVLNQTPSAFYHLIALEMETGRQDGKLNLKYIIFGGEALNPGRLKEWKEKYPQTKLINMFGITETTVHVTYKEITDREIAFNISNIGGALPTLCTYVMDSNLQLLPIGAAGELCVGGDGVGRGYLNRVELTGIKFVENPYIPGQVLYKSGDLVKLSNNGELEYLGRIDHQVKIRGYRIELGEIENRLLEIEYVKDAAVIAIERKSRDGGINEEGSDKHLCAYIVSDREIGIPASRLRNILSGKLPDYMIPSYFVQLREIPLTPNGKINRKALPYPVVKAGDKYAAPENEIQEKLTAVWSGVLNIDKDAIGIDADFFELGGHSLKTISMVSEIHKAFDVKIPVLEVFTRSTIRKLSRLIEKSEKSGYSPLEWAEKKEYYPLSPAQKGIYIQQQMFVDNTSYNMPEIQVVEGNMNKEKLERTIEKLIHRHESLRTSFQSLGDNVFQRIHEADGSAFRVDYHESDDREGVEAILRDFVKSFDLSHTPLLRVGLVKMGESKYILILDTHHIIADGASKVILVKEFTDLYLGKSLPLQPLHYKDFSEWRKRWLGGKEKENQEAYWLEVMSGRPPLLDLPLDYPRPAVPHYEAHSLSFEIDGPLTEKIKKLALGTQTTLFMVFLAVYNILLSKYTGQEDIVVGSPISGRNHADTRTIIGMFANILPFRNQPRNCKSFGEFLADVKKNVLGAFENQDYQYDELLEKLGVRGGSHSLFNVGFTFGDPETVEIDYDGLKDTGDLTFYPYSYGAIRAKYDLVIVGAENNGAIHMTVQYDRELFKRDTAEKVGTYYVDIVKDVVENSDIALKDIEIPQHLLVVEPDTILKDLDEFEF